MALTPTVLTDAYISINANVVSDHGNKVEISAEVEEQDTTAFGQTWRNRIGGLKDGSLAFTFIQNYITGQLDAIFWPLLGTNVAFEVRPTSTAVSSSNPKYTGTLFIKEWKPIMGSVGDLVTVDVTFPASGTVTRATA